MTDTTTDHPTHTEQAAATLVDLANLNGDIQQVIDFLDRHAEGLRPMELSFAGYVALKAGIVVRLEVQCRNADELAAWARVLMTGAPIGGVSRDLEDWSSPGRGAIHVTRRFGAVSLDAWRGGAITDLLDEGGALLTGSDG